ncbi:hypothetical protein EGR_05863 [Echinococcus granulosus]|uniref:Uncharacterized protein n=1 Tax=Echinococcus granulosus TaxID=6210 RepID=W6UMA7_ECHGR|nr:hypothetical protein EGR_05863 [Echinococcus granulosus]EUB59262.1 hypothetical protein EGR_05863 [Echinococcus granulosus]
MALLQGSWPRLVSLLSVISGIPVEHETGVVAKEITVYVPYDLVRSPLPSVNRHKTFVKLGEFIVFCRRTEGKRGDADMDAFGRGRGGLAQRGRLEFETGKYTSTLDATTTPHHQKRFYPRRDGRDRINSWNPFTVTFTNLLRELVSVLRSFQSVLYGRIPCPNRKVIYPSTLVRGSSHAPHILSYLLVMMEELSD